jgi:hypothetical protein
MENFLQSQIDLILSLQAIGGMTAVMQAFSFLGSEEFFLLLLPLVYLVRRERVGDGKALRDAVLVALPAIVVSVALRRYWTPHIHPPLPALATETLALAAERFRASWPEWRGAALLMGLTPLAVLGGFRRSGRRLASRGAYLFFATLASPFVNPVTFLSLDVDRLLLYAIPAVLPMALAAFDRVYPHVTAPRMPSPNEGWGFRFGVGLTAASLIVPFLAVDRYCRVDLQGTHDATVMLAFLRGSLDVAGDLDAGEEFVFDPSAGRYSRGLSKPFNLSQLRHVRWFLWDGWGPSAPRTAGDVVMAGREATLLLPCFRPRNLELTLSLDAPRDERLAVRVNQRPVGDVLATPESRETVVRIPEAVLFRGDNALTLAALGSAEPRVRLRRFTIRGS